MENIKDYSDFYRLEVHFDDYPYKAFNEVISIYYRTMDDLKSYLNHIIRIPSLSPRALEHPNQIKRVGPPYLDRGKAFDLSNIYISYNEELDEKRYYPELSQHRFAGYEFTLKVWKPNFNTSPIPLRTSDNLARLPTATQIRNDRLVEIIYTEIIPRLYIIGLIFGDFYYSDVSEIEELIYYYSPHGQVRFPFETNKFKCANLEYMQTMQHVTGHYMQLKFDEIFNQFFNDY